jgi:hypothetical protein
VHRVEIREADYWLTSRSRAISSQRTSLSRRRTDFYKGYPTLLDGPNSRLAHSGQRTIASTFEGEIAEERVPRLHGLYVSQMSRKPTSVKTRNTAMSPSRLTQKESSTPKMSPIASWTISRSAPIRSMKPISSSSSAANG